MIRTGKGAIFTMEEKKTMLSGIQPSGELHLGNYLGPLRHWPEMIEE